MGLGPLLKEFSGWTSAHGIPKIGAARNWPLRIIWVALFLSALGMFGFMMYGVISDYFTYGVVVATSITYDKRAFPAVTFCSLNPYKINEASEDSNMLQMMTDYTDAIVNDAIITNDRFYFNNQSDDLERTTHAASLVAYISNLWTDEEKEMRSAAVLDEILIECTFNGDKCGTSDFTSFLDPVYGMCYQFNNFAEPKFYGEDAGLRVMLWANQSEYMPHVETSTIKVAVHPANQEPFVDAFGFNIAIGYANALAVTQSASTRLQEPYGVCADSKDGWMFYYTAEEYSMEGCFRSCYQQFIVDTCGCADPRYAKLDEHTWCEIADLPCVIGVREAQLNGEEGAFSVQKCTCPQRCKDVIYDIVEHQAWWPQDQYVPALCYTAADQDACHTIYRENTVVFEVYFQTLVAVELDEEPAVELIDVIYNFGGMLGLWMGFSVITIVELVGLMMLMALMICAKMRGPQDMNSDNDQHAADMDDIDKVLDDAEKDSEEEENDSDDGDDSELSSVDPYANEDDESAEPPAVV